MERNQLEAACDAIRAARSAVVLCHQNPDADTLGSALALARALRFLGKEAIVLSEDGIPEIYDFIPEAECVLRETPRRDFDIGIACDLQEPFRAENSREPVYSAPTLLIIDHHILSEEPLPKYSGRRILLHDPEASATAEIVVRLLDELEIPLDPAMASQLMAGIVGDTGGFRFPNTTAETFELGARLARLGASAAEAALRIYETRSFRSTALLGRALASLECAADGKVVWAKVTAEDFRALGAGDSDTESIVNQVASVRGAKVAILFRELGKRRIRISIRSRADVDVRRIAAVFGGGGHERAAGCTIERPLGEAVQLMLQEVCRWMEC